MRESILFINPQFRAAAGLFNSPPLANLGMLYSAGLCRQKYRVTVLDSFCYDGSLQFHPAGVVYGCTFQALLDTAEMQPEKTYRYIFINFSSFLKHNLEEPAPDFEAFTAALKNRPGTPDLILADFLIGSAYYRKYDPVPILEKHPAITALLQGVGENNLLAFLAAPRQEWPAVPGLAYRLNGRITCNRPDYAYSASALDALAYPAFDLLVPAGYFRFLKQAESHNLIQENNEGVPFLPLMASRGCDHSCHFCGLNEIPHAWHCHSPEYLEAMLLTCQVTLGVAKFLFLDPCSNNDPQWFKAVLKMLCRHGFRCSIPNGLRADNLDDETLALLKLTINTLLSSAESADFSLVPGKFKPGFTPLDIEQLAKRCWDIRLPLKLHFMIGFPGETLASVFKTLQWATELFDKYNCIPLLQIVTPLPGTALYRDCSRKGYFTQSGTMMQKLLDSASENNALLSTPRISARELQTVFDNFQAHVFSGRQRELVLAPSYHCNNKCIHCFVAGKQAVIRSEESYTLLLQQARHDHRTVLCLEGGEPTLFPGLRKLIDRGRSLGFTVIMLESNGRRFAYRNYAQAIVKSGVTIIYIGLHSHLQAEHDAVTGVPGSFAQTVQGITNLLAEGFRTLYVNIALNRQNYRSLVQTTGFCAELGVEGVMIQYLSHNSRLQSPANLPAYAAVAPCIRETLSAWHSKLKLRVQNFPWCRLPGYEEFIHPDISHLGALEEAGGRQLNIVQALAVGRVKDENCSRCVYGFLCSGYLPGAGA